MKHALTSSGVCDAGVGVNHAAESRAGRDWDAQQSGVAPIPAHASPGRLCMLPDVVERGVLSQVAEVASNYPDLFYNRAPAGGFGTARWTMRVATPPYHRECDITPSHLHTKARAA
eukprot:1600855-Rhodomonas_salina.1